MFLTGNKTKFLFQAALVIALTGCGKALVRRDAINGTGGSSNTTTDGNITGRGALTEIGLDGFSSTDSGLGFDPLLKVLQMNGQSSPNLMGNANSPLLDMTDETLIAISVLPVQPYNKELPAANGSDAGYPMGNLSAADHVGYWRLNEVSSPYADSSKNGRNGTSGTAPVNTPGILRFAQKFDGTKIIQVNADAVDANDSLTLKNGAGVGTWMAWFSNDTPANNASLIRKGTDGNYAITYSSPSANVSNLNCEVSNGAATGNKKIVSAGVPKVMTNQWQHVACVYDGATLKMYLNGLLVGSVAAAAGSLGSTGTLKHFYIGGNGANNRYKGSLDEVAVYKRALPIDEIKLIFSRGEIFGIQYRAAATPSMLETMPFVGPSGPNSYYLPAYVDSNGPPMFPVPPQNGMYVQVRTRFALLAPTSRVLIKMVQPIYAPN